MAGLLAAAALYVEALRSLRSRGVHIAGLSRSRWCFMAGLAVVFLALQSPIHTYADRRLSVHMVQHLLLTMVAAPLLILGRPITVALAASSQGFRRRIALPVLRSRAVRIVAHPLTAWGCLTVVLWASHFSPVYNRALESTSIHAAEHVAYLGAALLFWWPLVGGDPIPGRLSHPARILYLFLAMPQTTFLGLASYSADHVLYAHYALFASTFGGSAIADQHLAGAIMWTAGMFLIVPALGYVLMDWLRRDELEASRSDRRLRAGDQLTGAPPGTSAFG